MRACHWLLLVGASREYLAASELLCEKPGAEERAEESVALGAIVDQAAVGKPVDRPCYRRRLRDTCGLQELLGGRRGAPDTRQTNQNTHLSRGEQLDNARV